MDGMNLFIQKTIDIGFWKYLKFGIDIASIKLNDTQLHKDNFRELSKYTRELHPSPVNVIYIFFKLKLEYLIVHSYTSGVVILSSSSSGVSWQAQGAIKWRYLFQQGHLLTYWTVIISQ